MARSTPSSARLRTRTGRWARTVGSPPVMRMLSNPNRSTQTRRHPGQLLVGEQLLAGQPLHALFRHAVLTAEVAAVGDRDAQVADGAVVGIDERGGHAPHPTARGAEPARRRPRATSTRGGTIGQAVGQGHGVQLVGPLAAGAGHVVAAVGFDVRLDPDEGGPPVAGAAASRRRRRRPARPAGAGRRRAARPAGAGRVGPGPRSSPSTTPGCRAARTPGWSPTSPKANGLAGRMATCIQRIFPMRSRTTLTRSKSPMLTPPLVSTASQRATPSASRPFDLGLDVAGDAEVDRGEAVPAQQGHQGAPVGVADLAREQRPASLDQLVTGREHADDGSRHGGHLFPARHCRARRGGRGRGRCRPAKTSWPAAMSSPARRTCSPAGAGAEIQTWSPSLRVFSTMATASAPSGKGAPVMIRSASPGPTGPCGSLRRRPACRSPSSGPGSAGAGAGHVGGPHGVAVHGRVGERGHVARPRSPARPGPARGRRPPPSAAAV